MIKSFIKNNNLDLPVRFIATGILNTLVGWLIYSVLILLGVKVWLALLLPTIIGVLFNFFTISKFAFRKFSIKNLPKFILVYILIYLINYFLISILNSYISNEIITQFLLLPFVAIISFLLFSKVVYK